MAPKKPAAPEKPEEPPKPPPGKLKWTFYSTFGTICVISFFTMLVLYIRLITDSENPLLLPMKKLRINMADGLRNPKIVHTSHLFKKGKPKTAGGWDFFGKSFYYISNEEKTWHDAESFCLTRDSHLASILSDEEQNYLTSQLSDPTWIGLTDENEEGNWKWTDGSRTKAQYWSLGNPSYSEHDGALEKDCTSIVPSSGGYNWNDDYCHKLHKWVCKENIDIEEP
ncbi:C-type lectin domain family 4 member F-like isoform X4 [Podarcis raffonei]|uniref:C-type lectin domain family 4 member F-like isoform X4 n=1 Tax=Podarcis raffonei TaxID=65483 RepID=UPI002329761A|nr:C-type lectin domain family 4 member F-like isoform X4 [Podarcis raffonei]